MSARRATPKDRSRTERLEWALGIVSGLLVVAVIGFLAAEGLSSADDLPDLAIVAEPADGGIAGGGQLRFTLSNNGGRAATAVAVSLTFRDGARIVAVQRLIVDQVPAASTVTGAFLVPPDAAGLAPALAVEGYLDP